MRSWRRAAARLGNGLWALLASTAVLIPGAARAQIGGCVPDLSNPVRVEIETNLGTIPIELFPNTAPGTVQNFLSYMTAGDYDGSIVHRSVSNFVIQGGGFREQNGAYAAIPTDPPIANEPCLSNTRGTLAMARLGGQPNSATSQWFINLADNLFLDSADGVGFTAFGRVAGGDMSVADQIGALPTYDALAILELPSNQALREMPLQSLPVDPPEGYGCSRADPVHALADESLDTVVPDPLRSAGFIVPFLLDPQCDGLLASGPPAIPCDPLQGRDVFLVDLPGQVFFFPRIPMSCDQVAESEASWAARRAGTTPQLLAGDVEVTYVPEPGSELLLLSGVLALMALARTRG